jgi:hypothetical protein
MAKRSRVSYPDPPPFIAVNWYDMSIGISSNKLLCILAVLCERGAVHHETVPVIVCPFDWSPTKTALRSIEVKNKPAMEIDMPDIGFVRRNVLAAGGALVVAGLFGIPLPARAAAVAATPSMRGGSNNYIPGAEIVDRIGGGGFWMTGTVRRAGDGAPLVGQRIQIWAHTTEGSERDLRSHGATLTDANGMFRLEMPQIVPALGQAHAHLAYDSGEYDTVFLRPLLPSPKVTSLEAHFVLQPA